MNRKDAKPAKISGIAEPDDLVNELSAQVVDAALEVHRNLGPGFFESVYEEALAVELHLRKVPFERQVPIGVSRSGRVQLAARVSGGPRPSAQREAARSAE